MELFARFSYTYPAGDQHIKNDNEINEILNSKLIKFLKENSIKEYRILNAETSQLPPPAPVCAAKDKQSRVLPIGINFYLWLCQKINHL